MERGLSQEALADAAHLHITLLGGLERGTGNPNYATIIALTRALSLTPGVLLTRADDIIQSYRFFKITSNNARSNGPSVQVGSLLGKTSHIDCAPCAPSLGRRREAKEVRTYR
jgi:transcriptional regulator with XRE-family HTH domain